MKEKFLKQLGVVVADMKPAFPYWFVILLISCSWGCFAAITYITNSFGSYSPKKLLEAVPFLPVVFFFLTWITGRFILSQPISKKCWMNILLSSAIIVGFLLVLIPIPIPALLQNHRLQIVATGVKDDASSGQAIEIVKLRQLDGTRIPFDTLNLSDTWQIIDNRLVSDGTDVATIEFSGSVYGGIVLTTHYDDDKGKVTIIWDGTPKEYNLYSENDLISNLIFTQSAWINLGPLQLMIGGVLQALYVFGLLSLVVVATLLLHESKSRKLTSLLIVGLSLIIFLSFLKVKVLYADFDIPRFHRDTYGYALTAEKPLASLSFWAGERAFTLPLVFKLLGINTVNYRMTNIGVKVATFQTWFSVMCWTLLGLVVGYALRKPWLSPWAFGVILFFSVGLEISMWDSVLLAEALSFSLFALLIGLWILIQTLPPTIFRSWIGTFIFGVMIVVTVFYNFTRDTNIFFIMVCAVVFFAVACLKKSWDVYRKPYLLYLVVVLFLFWAQNNAANFANRWQIHIYDHLATRILKDEQALKYFQDAGLPMSDKLTAVVNLSAPEYQRAFFTDPELEAVRQWVNERGKSTLIGYILSRPLDSLIAPLRPHHQMLNGSNLEYRRDRFPGQPTPPILILVTKVFYPRLYGILFLLSMIGLVGSIFYLKQQPESSAWLTILVLLLSIYPLMFVIWHANPLEIERHAAPIAMQLRVAGWIALVLLLPKMVSKLSSVISHE